MDQQNSAQFRNEGEPAFVKDTENVNSASSPEGEKTETGNGQPDGGQPANTQTKPDEMPFHEHPRWKQREEEWNTRFNSQEQRHQDDLRALREEFGKARQDNASNSKIPSWFGGTQQQWDEYRRDRDAEISQAEERAVKRLSESKEKEDKAVKEATDYLHAEIAALESDKTLNPTGDKVDPNRLLKIVMDNDLVDSKGRWNYRAGFAMLRASEHSKQSHAGNRKDVAAATNPEPKAETKPSTFKTREDFKKSRPW